MKNLFNKFLAILIVVTFVVPAFAATSSAAAEDSVFFIRPEDNAGLTFSVGSLFVLGATACWGLENNCTRSISDKSTYQIVTIKGLCSGTGSFMIALAVGEKLPDIHYIFPVLLLGFVAYGLSIFTYIRAQKTLGAAKTSAYYAVAPFVGAFMSFVFLRESLSWMYMVALAVMIGGSALVVADTLIRHHAHQHYHTFSHTHDGSTHTHTVIHSHEHNHYVTDAKHGHHHTKCELEGLPGAAHL